MRNAHIVRCGGAPVNSYRGSPKARVAALRRRFSFSLTQTR